MEADNSGISRDLCKNKDNLHLVSGTSMLVSREARNHGTDPWSRKKKLAGD